MSQYKPSVQDITLFKSMATHEFLAMPTTHESDVACASIRAALRFFVKVGAIKKSWLEKQDMVTETNLQPETIDDQVRELLTKHVGENGDTENLVQTLQRILDERDNVKRNRERK